MPSPIAHSAVAFLLWPPLRRRDGLDRPPLTLWSAKGILLLGGLLFMLSGPDLDMIPHLLLGEEAWIVHGGATHSFLAGAVAAVIFATVLRAVSGIGWFRLWTIGTIAWWSHIVLDYFTWRGGVAALWPITSERFSSPVPLFYGVRHSEPWAWHLHLITISTELVFLFFLWLAGRRIDRRIASTGNESATSAASAPVRHRHDTHRMKHSALNTHCT